MIGYHGGGFPHLLIVMLVGFVWLIVLAAVAAVLFLVIRFAVLSALKAHTRWADAGKPAGSAWSQRPAPHPGFGPQAPDAAPAPSAAAAPVDVPPAPPVPASPDVVQEAPDVELPADAPAPPAAKAPAKPRTPRAPRTPKDPTA